MRIIKYKKMSDNKYKIFLDNDSNIILYEDVILKFNLLILKEIDEVTLIDADKYNQECDVYYVALKCIKNRTRSINDLRILLIKKEYPSDLVEKAIHKLMKQGYLDDRLFAKSYINYSINNSNKGPLRISMDLLEKKVENNIIFEELDIFTEDIQKSKISKIIEKEIKTNHTRGGVVLKQKIYNNLKLLGYDISIINNVISNYSFACDNDIAKREYDKLYKKYSRRYSGSELLRKVNEKMYQKGLRYDEELFE